MKKILAAFALLLMAGFAHADALDKFVKSVQERGVVSNYQTRGMGPEPIITVRPVFHDLDFEIKVAIAASFLAHAQKQHPNAGWTMLRINDSRNNNFVGRYTERHGLQLYSPYD